MHISFSICENFNWNPASCPHRQYRQDILGVVQPDFDQGDDFLDDDSGDDLLDDDSGDETLVTLKRKC